MNSETVKLYSYTYDLRGAKYGGTIAATSFDEAEALIPFGKEFGMVIAEVSEVLCCICGEPIVEEIGEIKPIEEDVWPTMFDNI